MEVAATRQQSGTPAAVWAGRVMSAVVVLFLALDSAMKLAQAKPAMEATVQLGFPASSIFWIGAVLLAAVVIYAVPATAPLGAILLTGYLGGAIATNVRAALPLFSHTLFPLYVAVLVWGGLFLRDGRVRAVFSLRS